ncbi:G2/mitotic-specific cyclin-B2-like protein [Aphelenchoides avenae]|nr:G2/mitotic-specific cyclin-B2-like protein [Aphelenchus avenae]
MAARKEADVDKPLTRRGLSIRNRATSMNEANIMRGMAEEEKAKGRGKLKVIAGGSKPIAEEKPTTSIVAQLKPPTVKAFTARRVDSTGLDPLFKKDMITYMKYLELKHQLPEDFLAGSRVSGLKRSILVDWIMHVHVKFEFHPETLSLAISFVDRALRTMNITTETLQLFGVTCLFMACKFEEVHVPNMDDFVFLSAEAFTKRDILDMEPLVLKAVGFDAGIAHPVHFVRLYRREFLVTDAESYGLMKFIMDVALVEYALAHFRPSLVAAVSLYLVFLMNNRHLRASFDYAGLPQAEFLAVARRFVKPMLLHAAGLAPKLKALRIKHQHSAPLDFTPEQVERLETFAAQN